MMPFIQCPFCNIDLAIAGISKYCSNGFCQKDFQQYYTLSEYYFYFKMIINKSKFNIIVSPYSNNIKIMDKNANTIFKLPLTYLKDLPNLSPLYSTIKRLLPLS